MPKALDLDTLSPEQRGGMGDRARKLVRDAKTWLMFPQKVLRRIFSDATKSVVEIGEQGREPKEKVVPNADGVGKGEDRRRLYQRQYYLKNKERLKENVARRRAENRSKVVLDTGEENEGRSREQQYKREYYLKNKERIRQTQARWRAENRDKAAEATRRWVQANPERKSASKRAHYERNQEVLKARASARWYELTDSAVRKRFVYCTVLSVKDVPDDWLPAIRAALLVRSEIHRQRKGDSA